MNEVYVLVYENPWNYVKTVECAFTKEEDAKKYLENMYLSEERYESYNYDIEEVELDPKE